MILGRFGFYSFYGFSYRVEAGEKKNDAGANIPKNLWAYFNILKPKHFVSDVQIFGLSVTREQGRSVQTTQRARKEGRT